MTDSPACCAWGACARFWTLIIGACSNPLCNDDTRHDACVGTQEWDEVWDEVCE